MRVRIEGAGLAGLSCAWFLARAGARVVVEDIAEPGRGASWAAAGMIAPAFEGAGEAGQHPDLFALAMRSAAMWPEFAAQVARVSGLEVGYRHEGSVALATSPGEVRHLEAVEAALAPFGYDGLRLPERVVRAYEPALGSGVGEALLLSTDTQVDNRALVRALLAGLDRLGVVVRAHVGDEAGPEEAFDAVILARGWRSPGVSPVRGQLTAIAREPGHPERVVRAGRLYVAPKADRIIIGASVEPGRSDLAVEAEALDVLRERAARLCPSLARGAVLERWAGVRPVTRDGAPALGELSPGRYLAAGHGRNGVLLAPVTGAILSALVLDGKTDELSARFTPQRDGLRLDRIETHD